MSQKKRLFNKTNKLFLIVVLGLILSSPILESLFVQADVVETSVIIHVCGNGVIEGDEVCDDGIHNGQYGYCKFDCSGMGPYCGDGWLQEPYEECDDGNNVSGDGCDAVCQTEEAPPPPPDGAVEVPPPVPTKVILQGKAYPGSEIHILKDGKEITTTKADSKANFKKEITEITPGIYTFGLWAEDKDGIKSITYTFTFRVIERTITTVSGIFLPPTIGLDKTSIPRGEILNIFGQTVPEVEVDIHILSSEIVEEVRADEIGAWLLPFNTQPLDEGAHTTKARFQLNAKERSGFGRALNFYIGEIAVPIEEICLQADFNKDGRVNLVDFSIFLCWWGRANPQCDLNQNGIVDLPDFSILLCCWTG